MKNVLSLLMLFATFSLLTGCATIIGGSSYTAHVKVNEHPYAYIIHNGDNQGTGVAVFKVKWSNANAFSVTVNEENCNEQTISFERRAFRVGSFVGTVVGFTGIISGFPIPLGLAIDLATGALWKPDINEAGVSKTSRENYHYQIDYTGCEQQ